MLDLALFSLRIALCRMTWCSGGQSQKRSSIFSSSGSVESEGVEAYAELNRHDNNLGYQLVFNTLCRALTPGLRR